MTTNPTVEEIQAAINEAAATIRQSRIAQLELALKTLLESLRYTPLGIPQIKALAACELALATTTGEQVGLTDAELTGLWMNVRMTFTHTGAINFARAVIAAHEAKRVSCSLIAKKSTCDGGRVDGIEKSEHVGGAA